MAESKATISLDTKLSKIEVADEKTTVFTTTGENEVLSVSRVVLCGESVSFLLKMTYIRHEGLYGINHVSCIPSPL